LSVAVKYKAAPYGMLKINLGNTPLYDESNPTEAKAFLNSHNNDKNT
jgi:hypothetical protein